MAEGSDLTRRLIERVIQIQEQNGSNPQAVLGTTFFTSLPTDQKIEVIKAHRNLLAKDPKFNWGRVGGGILGSGALATTGTLLHQIGTKTGPSGFKANPWALAGAGILGAIVGGFIEGNNAKREYDRDMATKQNVDDAISVLVNRNLSSPVTKLDILNKIQTQTQDLPLTYGKMLSSIDFDALDKEHPATAEAPVSSNRH